MPAVKIGGKSLKSYLTAPKTPNKEQAEATTSLIATLGGPKGGKAFEVERLPLELLCQQNAHMNYPELDVSFLTTSLPFGISYYSREDSVEVKGVVRVPRFSVYQFMKSDSLRIQTDIDFDNAIGFRFQNGEEDLPLFIQWELTKSFGLGFSESRLGGETGEEGLYHFSDINQNTETLGKYRELELSNAFACLFPDETRTKIKEAQRIFLPEELYLIAETKPEQWLLSRHTRHRNYLHDPLVVGVKSVRCYLIDVFDATPIENQVSREFIKDSGLEI